MIDLLNTTSPVPLDLGSDLHLRYEWFTPESMAHPAKLHLKLLSWIVDAYTQPGDTVADPMAGIGSILYAASLQRNVIAREIEPRWLEIMHQNAAHIIRRAGLFAGRIDVGQADARETWGYLVDHIIFSPPYANAAASTPTARRMLPYRLSTVQVPLGERWKQLHDSQSRGAMGALSFHYGTHPAQIGHLRDERYWQAMRAIYQQAFISLRAGGYLVLVTKDHIFQAKRVCLADETIQLCEQVGFRLHAHHQRRVYPLSLWQRRRKEQSLPVVEEEDVLVFTKQGSAS